MLAGALAARSDAVAAKLESGNPCAARTEAEALQADSIAAVNDGRLPARYQEELGAAVSALVASIECAPPPATTAAEEGQDESRSEGEKPKKEKHAKQNERKGKKH